MHKPLFEKTGYKTLDGVELKGLPQTPGAPTGYGDLVSAVNATQNRTNAAPYASQLLNGNGGAFSAASAVTLAQMIMIPHEFVAVRIGYAHRGGSGPVTAAKLLVATTDDIGDLSQGQTNAARKYIVPIKNGVEYNEISANGWAAVTFGGGAEMNIADAGTNNFSFAFSDLIPLRSIPLAGNPARFQGCYPLLVRMFAGTAQYTKGGMTGFGETTGFIAESGKYLQLGCARAGDAVTTLSTLNASSTVSFGDDKSLPIIVQAYTNNGLARTILSAGDSRFASCSEFPSKLYRNLQFFIEQQAASLNLDYKCVAVAQGGQTMDAYNQRAIAYMNAGGFANCALYLAYSINDGVPTDAIMQNSKYKLILFIEKCREKGIVPLIVTGFPLGTGYTETSTALLNDFVSFISQLNVPHINPLQIYGQGNNYAWNPVFQFDNSHMNDIGYQDLAGRCISLIAQNT